jgi:hypothetical protein
MSRRRANARLQSLCGSTRRLVLKAAAQAVKGPTRRPCRHHAIWACQGIPDRPRRLAELPR